MVVLFSLWQGIFHVKISNCGQPDDKVSDMGHSWSRKSTFSHSLSPLSVSHMPTCTHTHMRCSSQCPDVLY